MTSRVRFSTSCGLNTVDGPDLSQRHDLYPPHGIPVEKEIIVDSGQKGPPILRKDGLPRPVLHTPTQPGTQAGVGRRDRPARGIKPDEGGCPARILYDHDVDPLRHSKDLKARLKRAADLLPAAGHPFPRLEVVRVAAQHGFPIDQGLFVPREFLKQRGQLESRQQIRGASLQQILKPGYAVGPGVARLSAGLVSPATSYVVAHRHGRRAHPPRLPCRGDAAE